MIEADLMVEEMGGVPIPTYTVRWNIPDYPDEDPVEYPLPEDLIEPAAQRLHT